MGVRLNPEGDVEIDSKKLYWPKNMLLIKYLQFHTYFAEILVISLTIGELILTNFDDDRTKIVDFLFLVHFRPV